MSRSKVAFALSLLVMGLVFTPDPGFAQTPGCLIVWANAPAMPGADETVRPRRTGRGNRFHYSADEVLDIDFYVLMLARSRREVELKIYTPQGHLYQTLATSRSAVFLDQATTSRGRRPRSLFVWGQAKLPVTGTSIVTSSLYGAWTAVPFVRGDSTPCAAPRAFQISR